MTIAWVLEDLGDPSGKQNKEPILGTRLFIWQPIAFRRPLPSIIEWIYLNFFYLLIKKNTKMFKIQCKLKIEKITEL